MLTEDLAYWFFRLNGCFTFVNFVVHPDGPGSQRTDADVIAVRFPHRQELSTSGRPMQDAPIFGSDRIQVFFAEVKTGACRVNGPWTRREARNLQRVLNAIGVVPASEVETAATALYDSFQYDSATLALRFAAIGRERSVLRPLVCQLTWEEILTFIHERMTSYWREKADHSQWDEVGQALYLAAVEDFRSDPCGFVRHWMQEIDR